MSDMLSVLNNILFHVSQYAPTVRLVEEETVV